MYRVLIIFIFSSSFLHAARIQEKGSIAGRVSASGNKPVAYVSVALKGSGYGTVTDTRGNFEIQAPAGKYTLVISAIGFEKIETSIHIEANKTITANYFLEESNTELQEVIVTGDMSNKFARRETDYVARMPLDNLENPQVYNVVGKELLQEQMVVNFDDALKNAPGVHKLWTSTGRGGDGTDYYSMRGFSVQPSIVNGIAGATNGSPDPANIERIETIKGPSGTLFGSSLISFGGLINTVTKKPYRKFGAEASYTGGSFGLSRITADVNTPLDEAKTALFRMNAAYHYENSFQDAGFRKSIFLAPSLSYQASERLSFLINTEFFSSESTSPAMLFLNRRRELTVNNPEDLKVNYEHSYTSNDITIKNPTVNLNGQINYKLSDKWTSQTNLSRSMRKSDGYYQYVMFILPGDTVLSRYANYQNSTSINTGIQQNFVGDFRIGNMRNRLLAGIDFLNMGTINNNSGYVLFDTLNMLRPDPNYGRLTRPALDAMLAQNNNPVKTNSNSNTYSIYVSDVINITEELMAMLSLRLDRFENKGTLPAGADDASGDHTQTALSPKFGIIYQVVKNKVSLFANYMNGFQNVAPVTQPDGSVDVFDPQQANQLEGGIKAELLSGRISGTLSYYDIYVSNVTRPDPDRAEAGYVIQDGNISSKGIEVDIIVNPIAGLNIVAGYGYNKSINDKTSQDINGRRPVLSGPEHLANIWVSYNLEKAALKGLGMGAGFNYASENFITNNSVTGQFILPSYTVFNAAVFYDKPRYRFGLKLDNLADKKYWGGWTTVEPMMPRRILASMTLKF